MVTLIAFLNREMMIMCCVISACVFIDDVFLLIICSCVTAGAFGSHWLRWSVVPTGSSGPVIWSYTSLFEGIPYCPANSTYNMMLL